MTTSQGKNLAAISKAIDQHNGSCDVPPTGIWMNPFEVERLGWDEIRGIPIKGDPDLQTGRFRITCDKDETGVENEEEIVEAVSEDRELVTHGVGWPD